MAMLYSYVPSQVSVKVFGIELVGLSKDNFITIERIDNAVTFRKSMDGNHTAFVDEYGSYRVTLSFSQVSESNELLHVIQKLYTLTNTNIMMPLTIREKSTANGGTATTFSSKDTFIETEPTTTFSSELGDKQWVFICNNASYNIKGTTENGFIGESLGFIMEFIGLYNTAENILGIASDISGKDIKWMIENSISMAEEKLKNMF